MTGLHSGCPNAGGSGTPRPRLAGDSLGTDAQRRCAVLYGAVIFLVVAIVAGLLGFVAY
jgi:hypothetical protein